MVAEGLTFPEGLREEAHVAVRNKKRPMVMTDGQVFFNLNMVVKRIRISFFRIVANSRSAR